MKKLMLIAALAALAAGCGVKKITYEKKVDREGITTTSYRIYQNDHWLNTKASAFKGGMTSDGKFEFEGEGLQSSPSEEFNAAMKTYTSAIVQLMQIAAAAYNPSASAAASSGKAATPGGNTTVNVATGTAAANGTAATSGTDAAAKGAATAECADGNCTPGAK